MKTLFLICNYLRLLLFLPHLTLSLSSIKSAETIRSPTEAFQLISFIIEVIVVSELFSALNLPVSRYDDMFMALHIDDLGRTICVTRVIQVSRLVSVKCRVYYVLFVQPEQVAVSYALLLIHYFTFVRHFVTDSLPHILYHNVTRHQTITES